jgi:hypothetical protein
VDHAPRNRGVTQGDVGVREVDREEDVVLRDRRAEKKWPFVSEPQSGAGNVPCALVVDAVLTSSETTDIAVGIEDREGLPLLEHATPRVRER